MGTVHEDQYTFCIISLSILLRTRNVSDKKEIIKKIKTRLLCLIIFFLNRAVNVCEKMWKNIVEQDRTHDNMAHVHCMLDN